MNKRHTIVFPIKYYITLLFMDISHAKFAKRNCRNENDADISKHICNLVLSRDRQEVSILN